MPKSQTFARPLRLSNTLEDFKSLHGYHSIAECFFPSTLDLG